MRFFTPGRMEKVPQKIGRPNGDGTKVKNQLINKSKDMSESVIFFVVEILDFCVSSRQGCQDLSGK